MKKTNRSQNGSKNSKKENAPSESLLSLEANNHCASPIADTNTLVPKGSDCKSPGSESPKKQLRPGVSDETLENAGIRKVTAGQDPTDHGQNGIWIPYHDWDGKPITENGKPYGRLRVDVEDPSAPGKYKQRKDSDVHLYIPPGVECADVVVEGEFKALSLVERGIQACGVSGLACFQKVKGVFVDELRDPVFNRLGITLEFLGDSDTATNHQFPGLVLTLLAMLPKGYSLFLPRLPLLGPKGIDDCFQEWGDAWEENWDGLTRIGVDPKLHKGKRAEAELQSRLLREVAADDLREYWEDSKQRLRVYRCLAAMSASPTTAHETSEWVRETLGLGLK